MINLTKKFISFIGRILRNVFSIRFPENIYKFLSFNGIFSVQINNQKINFNHFKDEISNHIFYSGIFGNYEGFSIKIWNQLCKKVSRSHVLDIGGFSGVYSLVAASANQNITIHTFEPHPSTYSFLKKNISINRFNNINSYNFALLDSDGIVNFYNSKGTNPPGFTSVKHDFIESGSETNL